MNNIVGEAFKKSLEVKERFMQGQKNISGIIKAAEWMVESFEAGGKLLLVGNGGSAADCQHMAAEFINRFELERPPLPALALTTNTSDITSIGNDYSFDLVFSKQVRALGRSGDVLIAISTSGNSRNIVAAVKEAKAVGIKTIGLTGNGGGALRDNVDLLLSVDSGSTPRIQETHITVCHAICSLVDHMLFAGV